MQIQPVHCPACQAVVDVPPEMDRVACEYCGTVSVIEHSEGRVTLKLAEEIAGLKQSLQDSTSSTVHSIQVSSENTQREIQHLRLTQELTLVETRLAGVQAEIATLQRNTDKKAQKVVKSQLATKQQEAAELEARRTGIESSISALYPSAEPAIAFDAEISGDKSKGRLRGCLGLAAIWLLSFLIFAMLFSVTIGDPIILPTIFSLAAVGFIYYRRRKKTAA